MKKKSSSAEEKARDEFNTRPVVEISVRSLVEFLLVEGDIDDRVGSINPVSAMNEGSRIHKAIQKKGGPDYHAEVPLSYTADFGEYSLLVRGRADGIIYDDEGLIYSEEGGEDAAESFLSEERQAKNIPVTIDEIKGIYRDVREMTEPVPVHLAQAKCYAYIFALENQLDLISVRLTYVNLDKEDEIQYLESSYSFEELEDWFLGLIESYRRWADFSFHWKKERNASIENLSFPFPYREGQKKLISQIYYCIDKSSVLFLQAPTGTGKTLATVYPAVKAMGEGKAERIFYLTAKNVTRGVAEEAFSLLRKEGLAAKTLTITARDKACFLETPACNPENCEYARGYYDRLLDSLYDFLTLNDAFGRDSIEKFCGTRKLCPYHFSLALADWSDALICDYNYVFDPVVAISRFFGEGKKEDYVFLVDEAHNLVERGRDMYSAVIGKDDVLAVRRFFPKDIFGIKKALTRVNNILNEWKKACEDVLFPEDMEGGQTDRLAFALMTLSAALEKYFDKRIENEHNDAIREFYFNARFFLSLLEDLDEGFVFYCDFGEGRDFLVHLFCADPSAQLQRRLDYGRATVFFSATLLPMDYYKHLLCREERPYAAYASSVFDPARLGVFTGTDVTSLYKRRSDDMYRRYSLYIAHIVKQHPGRYLVFFPSYFFMNNVYDRCTDLFPSGETELLLQTPDMKEGEKAAFLSRFRKGDTDEEPSAGFETEEEGSVSAEENYISHETVLGFCVMGGAFGEGIDLRGEALIGAIIVGAALPKYSHRQEILKNYFAERGLDGFSYAYLYPGMNKVLQAAGRVIRTEEDYGIVALLDSRFAQSSYRAVFPEAWRNAAAGDEKKITEEIGEFWKKFSR